MIWFVQLLLTELLYFEINLKLKVKLNKSRKKNKLLITQQFRVELDLQATEKTLGDARNCGRKILNKTM